MNLLNSGGTHEFGEISFFGGVSNIAFFSVDSPCGLQIFRRKILSNWDKDWKCRVPSRRQLEGAIADT